MHESRSLFPLQKKNALARLDSVIRQLLKNYDGFDHDVKIPLAKLFVEDFDSDDDVPFAQLIAKVHNKTGTEGES